MRSQPCFGSASKSLARREIWQISNAGKAENGKHGPLFRAANRRSYWSANQTARYWFMSGRCERKTTNRDTSVPRFIVIAFYRIPAPLCSLLLTRRIQGDFRYQRRESKFASGTIGRLSAISSISICPFRDIRSLPFDLEGEGAWNFYCEYLAAVEKPRC